MPDDFIDIVYSADIPLGAPLPLMWEAIADFGGVMRWWPQGVFTAVDTEGSGEGMFRHIHTADGRVVSEQLALLDPDAKIMELELTEGLPPWMDWYICRYHLSPRGAGCRLNWAPQASIITGTEDQFHDFVEAGLGMVRQGLQDYANSQKVRSRLR